MDITCDKCGKVVINHQTCTVCGHNFCSEHIGNHDHTNEFKPKDNSLLS